MHRFQLPVKLSHQDASRNRTRQATGEEGEQRLCCWDPEVLEVEKTEGEYEVSQQTRQELKRWGHGSCLYQPDPWGSFVGTLCL